MHLKMFIHPAFTKDRFSKTQDRKETFYEKSILGSVCLPEGSHFVLPKILLLGIVQIRLAFIIDVFSVTYNRIKHI